MPGTPAANTQRGLEALASETRRDLLKLIGDRELPVGEIADLSGLRQPATSQHLRVLREARLVSVRVEGNRRLYSVDFAGIQALRTALEGFWGKELGSLKEAAERHTRQARRRP